MAFNPIQSNVMYRLIFSFPRAGTDVSPVTRQCGILRRIGSGNSEKSEVMLPSWDPILNIRYKGGWK